MKPWQIETEDSRTDDVEMVCEYSFGNFVSLTRTYLVSSI